MHCDEASRRLYAGEASPELDVHLSACDECRLLAEDLAQLGRAFRLARAEWAPSASFRVRLPAAPWRRLAVAACLLVVPLAAWAGASLRPAHADYDLTSLLEPRPAAAPSTDREILASLFLEESRP
jgi:hypothetical protein